MSGGRTTNLHDTPGAPVKRSINALVLVKEPTSQHGGKKEEHDTWDLNVSMQDAVTTLARLGE